MTSQAEPNVRQALPDGFRLFFESPTDAAEETEYSE